MKSSRLVGRVVKLSQSPNLKFNTKARFGFFLPQLLVNVSNFAEFTQGIQNPQIGGFLAAQVLGRVSAILPYQVANICQSN